MATKKPTEPLKLAPINKRRVTLKIVGTSTLIQHNWSEKALHMMREKHAGKKTKKRDVRDPEQEANDAMYRTADGTPGVPGMAIKKAIIAAAHKDIGCEKTLVRKALFLVCDDPGLILPLVDFDDPEFKEDVVRVGAGATDLRYRPYFHRWAVVMTWEIDAELLQVGDLVNLIDRAGFGVGICEWRPEKNGEHGRFKVDQSFPIDETEA